MGAAFTPPPLTSQTLSDRINTSTRSTHTDLNRLIIARLPLALSPHTDSPYLYLTGLLHIAPIYITFEALWQNIIAKHTPNTLYVGQKEKSGRKSAKLHQPCDRIKYILSMLFLPELLRSERLRSDISLLSGKSSQKIDESLTDTSQAASALSRFIEHTENSVSVKPHVLVAYTWVLYMALFSGGRYLRASLRSGAPDFWLRPSQSKSPSVDQSPPHVITSISAERKLFLPKVDPRIPPHLGPTDLEPLRKARASTPHQFFEFGGIQDGEDTKKEFKRRFSEMDVLFSDREKDEIVQEAQHIFSFIIGIVGDLDIVCDTRLEQRHQREMGDLQAQD